MGPHGRWQARAAAAVTAAALAAGILAAAAPAQAASAEESKVVALTNQVRASVGAPALTWDEGLAAIARGWAAKMAADGIISHNPDYTHQITGTWAKASENVGQGPDIDTIHRALIASHSHYVNMTDTEVDLIGVGVVTAGNTVFIVENFLGRSFAAAPAKTTATTKAPAPPTTVAPKAPAPAPPTTVAPTAAAAVPVTVPVAAPVAAAGASPWMTLAIEVTRTWERATG